MQTIDTDTHRRLLTWAEANQLRYAEGYYERGEGSAYFDYSWKPELITPHINLILGRSGVGSRARILDFGCAKGFYVRVLRQMGYDAMGVDISEYALAHSPADVRESLFRLRECPLELFQADHFDLTIAKDTLEHVPEFALQYLVDQLKRISRKFLVLVPVCRPNRRYVNDGDELDTTHEIRYTVDEWTSLLGDCAPEHGLCQAIKRDKSQGTLCCMISRDKPG